MREPLMHAMQPSTLGLGREMRYGTYAHFDRGSGNGQLERTNLLGYHALYAYRP